MNGNRTRKSVNSCDFEPFFPLSELFRRWQLCEKARSALCYRPYSTTDGAGIDRVAKEISSLKNRPFVGYSTSAQNYQVFYF